MLTTSASLLGKLRKADDPQAWERFVRLYSPILYAWAGRMGLQHADALDLVQDVFAGLVQKLPEFTYDPDRGFRNWLFIVTKNKYLEKNRRRVLPVDGRVEPAEVPGRDGQDPARDVDEADFHRFMLGQLLPSMAGLFQPSTWQAFMAHVVEGQPAAAVASRLGITVSAVFKAKARVLSRVHRELADLLPGREGEAAKGRSDA